MSFLQRWLGGQQAGPVGPSGSPRAGGSSGGAPEIAPDELVDVRFNEADRSEAQLAQLFDGYERALHCDREVADEMLASFLERFASTQANWRPAPAAIEAARATAAAASAAAAAGTAGVARGGAGGSAGRRAQVQVVTGCSGGHPRALLAAAAESLERAPCALGVSAPVAAAAATPCATDGGPPTPDSPAARAEAALLQAAGLPALRALRVLQRSQHNRAVLASLGLLPALCSLLRALVQKLQAAAGVLVLRNGSGRGGAGGGGGTSAPGQVRLLLPLMALLCEALSAVQEFAEEEAAQHRQTALLGSQPGSRAASHAGQAAAAQAASAGAAASASALSAAAVAPLFELGLPVMCCELLPLALRIQLHCGGSGSGGSQAQEAALSAAAAAVERQALQCLLALQAASPSQTAAALLHQQGGQPLTTLVQQLGWPIAAPEHQLPLSTAAASSTSNLAAATATAAAAAAAGGEELAAQQEAEAAPAVASGHRYVRVSCGAGLRTPAEELQLQLLAVRALGAAALGGGSAALRVLQQHACFARLTQLLQWAAQTFCSSTQGATAAAGEAAAGEAAAGEGTEPQQVFQALWTWLGGSGSSGTAKALLPLLLGAVLGAFRSTGPAARAAAGGGEARNGSAAAGGAAAQPAAPRLEGRYLAYHKAAVAALCQAGAECCLLQQQTLLFVARLLGREALLLPLLPPACQALWERHAGSGGHVRSSANEALGNLQALRAAGLWEVVFGPCFFFWGELALGGAAAAATNAVDAAAAAGEAAVQPAGGAAAAAAAAAGGSELARQQREQLRQMVLVVLEAAGTLPAASSNLPEVSVLLRLLQQHPRRHGITAAACRALLRLLGAAPATTQAALQERQLLVLLPRLLAAQQQAGSGMAAAGQGGPGDSPTAAGGGPGSPPAAGGDAEQARCAALELLGSFMSMHASIQRAAVAAWEPVAALFALLLQPASPSRRLALDNVLLLMQAPPAGEDDRLAKAALFSKYTETLPAAVARWRQLGMPLLLELLGGMRVVVAGGASVPAAACSGAPGSAAGGAAGGTTGGAPRAERAYAQQLVVQAQALLQVCNALNEEYPQETAAELCCCVLDTLSALVAGSPAHRAALADTVGYSMLLEAVLRRLEGAPPPRPLLLAALGLLLEEPPSSGASPHRFTATAVANLAALGLLLALLRRAAWPDQLWGLAAFRELLLQGVHNLCAADAACLNRQVIVWLSETVAEAAAAAAATEEGAPSGGEEAAEEAEAAGEGRGQRLLLLQHQLLSLLRLSGSYSISARDLRSLLQLLRPDADGRPPPHAGAVLEAMEAMASHRTGPACFFNFGSGSGAAMPGQAGGAQQQQPSGIVCSASLGGGGGASTGGSSGASAAGSSSSSFLRLPKQGYSFAAWVRLEDGRAAIDQLLSTPHAAAGASAAATSDQALFALLHQQKPPSGAHQAHHFPFGHGHAPQLLQGVALAVRQVDSPMLPAGSVSPGGQRPPLQLVAHSWSPKHAEAALPLQQPLLPGRWHHVALTHSAGGPLTPAEVCLYLDGQLQATARLRYPAIKEPLSSVCMGAGALLRPLRGQAGAALLFEDLLAPAQVAALHQLGPEYQSPLIATESSDLLDQHPSAAAALSLGAGTAAAAAAAAASPQGLPPRLLLAFCPQLTASAAAEDSSSAASGGGRRVGRAIRDAVAGLPAALLTGAQLCRTRQPGDMLHCLGGIAVLLPLLEQGPPPDSEGSGGGSDGTAAAVLRLLAAMLRGNAGNQQGMEELGGFALIAHLLERQQRLLGTELLAAQRQLLAAAAASPTLSRAVLGHLLLNLRLWSAAAPVVQLQLLGLWHQLAAGEPLVVRCLLPPAHLLHHVRRCHFSRGEEARQRRRAAAATAGVQQQGGAAADADADAAAAGELRRGYLQLAGTLIHESSAAAARQAGGGAPAGSSAQSADDGLQADVQSILSLVADCCTTLTAVGSGSGGDASASDSTLLQELLSVLLLPLLRRDSLARLPLLACLQRQGGASLLLPLLCLEQQQLRLLGLRAITACLSGGDIATLGRSRSATPEPGASSKQGASLARARPGSAAVEPPGDEASDVIAAAGEALAAFPLTAATRIALLELLCDGAPWRQIDSLAPAGPPAAAAERGDGLEEEDPSAAASYVRLRHPGAAAVLLQAARAAGDGQERVAVLDMLGLLCESASLANHARHANADMLAAAPCCWQALVLDCLRVDEGGSPRKRSGGAPAASLAQPAAAGAAWRLLVLLLARGVAVSSAGCEQLRAVVGHLKAAPPGSLYWCPSAVGKGAARSGASSPADASSAPAWHLLQDLLADVLHELLAAQAEDAAGTAEAAAPASSPRAAAAAAARAAGSGLHRALSLQPRRATSEWDAWTHVSQWATEPYCSNAAALLSLVEDFLGGTVLPPPGGSLAPGGTALMWAAPSGGSDATRGGGSADTIPVAAWQELGAAPKQQPQLSSALLQNAWRFLDRLHSSGAAAAAAEAGASPRSTTAALLGALPAVSEPAAASKGLGEQQLLRHQQQRSFLLLHRLLLQALLQAAPERAQQAVAQAAQLLPPLLADAASDAAAAEAAASRLQLLLAAVVQCHRGVAARAAAAQQQEQLLPLSLQQRLAACVAAANAIVHAAPWAFGLHQPRAGQQVALAHAHPQQEGQAQQRSMQEMMGLLQARAVLAAAQQQVQFMRHCCALHERAALELAQAVTAAQARQHVRAEAAQEASQQSLGKLLAADRLLRAAARHAGDEEQQRRARQWRDLRRGLTTGRGLWAEEEDREACHWKLDATEDPSRRRLRLRRNYRFVRYSDAPSKGSSAALASPANAEPDEAELLALAALVPAGSLALADKSQGFPLEREEEGEEGEEEAGEERERLGDSRSTHAAEQPQQQAGQPEEQRQGRAAEGGGPAASTRPPGGSQEEAASRAAGSSAAAQEPAAQEAASPQQPAAQQPVQQAQRQAAAEARPSVAVQSSEDVEAPAPTGAEAPLFTSRCQCVTPKRVTPGLLHITPSELCFVGDPTESPEAGAGDDAAGGGTGGGGGWGGEAEEERAGGERAAPRRRVKRWRLTGLTEVHHSRYLLQPTAIECFMADRRSHALLNFPSNQAMRSAAAALQRACPSVALYDRKRKVQWALRLQQRWLRHEINTFDYLMALNTLAGRTYADLNQYPVLPWMVSDYSSPTLDLTSPASFRDLSKPVGALEERRLQFFLDRFESLRADAQHSGGGGGGEGGAHGSGHLPPFHYGTHYSSAGIVLFYLIRLEGFTKLNRQLQGGRFDHGDRLFHSMAATWQACLTNTADVKELVPEFYYQPEFLRNSDGFDLGARQDGVPVGDVVLPPWANGSPERFVRLMREALESEHASAHMHEWIDLVFGCKQKGKAAEEAHNVFFPLTYEGTADLDALPDPSLRAAVEDQIRHFGQTPMQLFRRRHPVRGPPPPPALNPLLNGPDVLRRSALVLPPPHRSGTPVVRVWVVDGRLLQLHGDGTVATGRYFPAGRQDLGTFTFSPSGLLPDTSAASIEADPLPPRLLAGAWAAGPPAGDGGAASPRRQLPPGYVLLHGDRAVLSGGYWDGSLRAHSPDDGRLLQSLCYHKDAVTCLAASADGAVVVTGSADTTLIVLEAQPAFGRAPRNRQAQVLPLQPRPHAVLYGHRDAVTCVAVSPELDLVASGSADGALLLHSLSSGQFVRALALPLGVPPTLLRLVPSQGALLVHSHTDLQLHLYSLNCRHIASADTHERLAALAPTPDGRLLLAAGTSGLVTLRWLHSLAPVLRYDAGRGPVTALALTPGGCFLAGTAEGSVVLFSPDARRRITTRFNLAS